MGSGSEGVVKILQGFIFLVKCNWITFQSHKIEGYSNVVQKPAALGSPQSWSEMQFSRPTRSIESATLPVRSRSFVLASFTHAKAWEPLI